MTLIPPPSTDANNPRAEYTHEHRYYRFGLPIAVLALIVSGVAAGFTWYQAYLVGEGNELARKNNIVSQRAFVYFSPNTQPGITGETIAPTRVNFFGTLSNSGNTPTKDLTFFFKCAPSGEDLKEPWSIFRQGKDQPERGPQFIGGHASVPVGCGFSWEQMLEMQAGRLFGYLMVEAVYWDRLDVKTKHMTQATFMLTQVFVQPEKIEMIPAPANLPNFPPLKRTISPLLIQMAIINRGAHNCADEECPAD
jgi:hypothetical protein